jgi:hypothetical protein
MYVYRYMYTYTYVCMLNIHAITKHRKDGHAITAKGARIDSNFNFSYLWESNYYFRGNSFWIILYNMFGKELNSCQISAAIFRKMPSEINSPKMILSASRRKTA